MRRPTFLSLLLGCAVLALAGCAADPIRASIESGQAFTIDTPPFIGHPVAILLTNTEPFSAKATMSAGAQKFSGQLFCSQDRILFLPDPPASSKKIHKGISFIWNAAENSGYVLCEALQGYAPIITGLPVTAANLQAESNPAFEQINGHSCRRTEAQVTLTDNSTSKFNVWRATDLKRIPFRIESTGSAANLVINLSNVQFKNFEPDLFSPPSGFTRYPSSDALTTELVVRTAAMKKPAGPLVPMDRPIEAYDNMNSDGRPPGR